MRTSVLLNFTTILLLGILYPGAYSQETREINGQRFEFYNTHPGSRVLFFDHKGLLWAGTWNGIIRYDAYSNEHIKENPLCGPIKAHKGTGYNSTIREYTRVVLFL